MTGNLPRHLFFFALLLVIGVASAISPREATAHATLDSTDPPIDGLVVTSPESITMSFTEDVATSPAPVVTLLDAEGNAIPDDSITITPGSDSRTLNIAIPELDRGTWTVSWTVTSATDGHTLSGAWAFRVGGGLPPGQATTADESPPVWAVALRWLTFLGASTAAGLLLFPYLYSRRPLSAETTTEDRLEPTTTPPPGPSSLAVTVALGASIVALLATLAEPVALWLTDRSISLGDHFGSLPDAWLWRPAALIPAAILLAGMCFVPKLRAMPIATAGAAFALASILGLVLTSHAAGREDYRLLATISNAIHQWSVALWTGVLVAFVFWSLTRNDESTRPALRIRQVSTTALVLFAVAVVTGVINTGFIFPIIGNIQDDGFSLDAFSELWDSRYGITLLVKLGLLLIPFALAIYHRDCVAKIAQAAGTAVTRLTGTIRQTLRWEIAAVALVIAGGSALALSTPPTTSVDSETDSITLVSGTTPQPEEDSLLAHLTVDPAQAGDNELTIRVTDWNGEPIPTDPAPRVTLTFTSLDHGASNPGVALDPVPDSPATFATSGLNLSLEGWWEITASISRSGQQNASASFYVLLPDPNTQGSDAPPAPESDPEAEALFDQAYAQMLSWQSVRWSEHIGSGSDVLVIGNFAVIDGGDTAPNAYSLDVVYSGSFAPTSTGAAPPPPTFGNRSSITIGDQGWLRTTDGDWLEEPPTNFSTPAEWDNMYAGATNFRLGTTQEIDGIEAQVITFYLPEQSSQSEAWFTWWIDPSTGDVLQVAMIARLHYMTWNYTDFDEPFTIEPPA
jgi:methionine-rich copper-binding protein CopC/putative copper export protein